MHTSYERAVAELTDRVRSSSDTGVRRFAVPVEGVEPLAWLARQRSAKKIYWRSRRGDLETAGIGEALSIGGDGCDDYREVFAQIHTLLHRDPMHHTRLYGGFRFNGDSDPAPPWKALGAYRFTLPLFEVLKEQGQTWLVCNLKPSMWEDYELSFLSLQEKTDGGEEFPDLTANTVVSRTDLPDFDEWRGMLHSAMEAIDAGRLEKLVLARQTLLRFREQPDVIDLAQRLVRATPSCFHFVFQVAGTTAFLGATPELLCRRRLRRVQSESVAGTRPSGSTESMTRDLGQELLGSDKDMREHRFVRESIASALAPLCETLDRAGEVGLLRLATSQHLYSRFSGTLRAGTDEADLLSALHPTPAVGGCPTGEAVRAIGELEPFDRGWYAGPIGWVGRESSEFAVGIRSGLLEGRDLHLFAGAGVVEGSTPEMEWEEIENKISSFIALVTEHDA